MAARPVGAIPGRAEEIRYRRGGRYPGWYKHPFRSRPRILTMSDGSLWITQDGERWLDNPRRKSMAKKKHHKKRHHYRRNELGQLLAAWNPRRGHRHNADIATMALRRPMDFATQAGVGMLSAYGVVTVGNLIATFVPIQQAGWTGTFVRAGSRGLAAWGLDQFVGPMVGAGNRAAMRFGAIIGLGGSLLLELIGQSFTLGVGDQFQMPGRILGLAGAGYTRIPLRGAAGAGYSRIPIRGISGAVGMPRDRTAQQNSWIA